MRWIVIGWAVAAISVVLVTLGASILARRRAAQGEGPRPNRLARWLAAGPNERALSLGLTVLGVFVVIPLLLFITVKALPDEWTGSATNVNLSVPGEAALERQGQASEGRGSPAGSGSALPVPQQMTVYRSIARLQDEVRCAALELYPDDAEARTDYMATRQEETLATVSRHYQIPEAQVRKIRAEGERQLWPVAASSCE